MQRMIRGRWLVLAGIAVMVSAGFAGAAEAKGKKPDAGKWTKARFQECDKDGDRKLSLEEGRECGAFASGESGDSRFAKMDKDGDGFVTHEEARSSASATGAAHAGGAMSQGETRSRSGEESRARSQEETRERSQASAKEHFRKMDADGDGLVTLEEAQAAGQFTGESGASKFTEFDTDGDGKLSQDEVGKMMAHRERKQRDPGN